MSAAVSARGLALACSLAQVGILTRAMGEEGYGLWATLLAIAGFITFFDFGIGIGLETALAEAFARGDHARLRDLFATGLALLAGVGVAYGTLGVIAAFAADWAEILKLTDANLGSVASVSVASVVVVFSLGVPLNLAPRLAGALQRGRIQAAWNTGGALVSLVLAAWGAWAGWSWLAVVVALSLVPLVQNLGLLLQLYRQLGWTGRGRLLPLRETRAMLRANLLVAVPQLGLGLLQALPPLAIAAHGGPAAATAFNLIQRIAGPLNQAVILFLTPLWPTYVEANTRGDVSWLRRMLAISTALALGAVTVLFLLVALRAEVLPWWAGSGIVLPPARFAWLAAAWFAALLLAHPFYYFLVGIREWRTLCVAATVAHGTALAALFVLGEFRGPDGALAGGLAGVAGLWLPALVWTTGRALRTRSRAP